MTKKKTLPAKTAKKVTPPPAQRAPMRPAGSGAVAAAKKAAGKNATAQAKNLANPTGATARAKKMTQPSGKGSTANAKGVGSAAPTMPPWARNTARTAASQAAKRSTAAAKKTGGGY
jgi:hypothetical protein